MSEKFWIEIAMAILGTIAVIGVFKTKTAGWGSKSIQAITVALIVPTVVILAVEGILNSQAVAAIFGGMVGFGAGKASSSD